MGTKLRKSIGAQLENAHVATHSVSVGTGTAASVMITAPAAGTTVHMEMEVFSSDAWTADLSETPVASGGTGIVSYCKDRGQSGSASSTVVHTVTYTSSGSILENLASDGALPIKTARYVLGASTVYLLYINAAGAATTIDVNVHFWED